MSRSPCADSAIPPAPKITAPFYAYDAVSSAADQLYGDDIIIANTLGDLAANCHLIFLCLPSAKEVNEVIFGAGGIAELAQGDLAIIDTSTIDRL